MRALLVALLFAFAPQAEAAIPLPLEQCESQATFGFPTFKKQNIVAICRNGYLSYFDTQAKVPALVSYVLKPANAFGCARRDQFRPDPLVGNVPTTKDYSKSGYDIGHMVSAYDLAYNEMVAYEAGFMTNMAPQLPSFNRGIWKRLETRTRNWAITRQSELQVYVASVYNRKRDKMIGPNQVTVPSAFVRVVIDMATHETQIFMLRNEKAVEDADLNDFITSLAEIQRRTGIEFPLPPQPEFTRVWVNKASAARLKAQACSTD